jgi:hypothetical protein
VHLIEIFQHAERMVDAPGVKKKPLAASDTTSMVENHRVILSQLSFDELEILYRQYVPRNTQQFLSKTDLVESFCTLASPEVLQTVVAITLVSQAGGVRITPFNYTDDPRYSVISQMPNTDLAAIISRYFRDVALPSETTALLDFLFRNAPSATIQTIHDVALIMSRTADETGQRADTMRRKRQRHENWNVSGIPDSDVESQFETRHMVSPDDDEDAREKDFFQLPSSEQVKQCYRAYYEATHPNSLKKGTCAVCAREVDMLRDQLKQINLDEVPNLRRLRPHLEHEAHDTYRGALLEPSGVSARENTTLVSICSECLKELSKPGDLPPRHSLANNLWIGRIPWELARLTVPEQLLIALVYPRVFVYKLHNKTWVENDTSRLQRGMRGTVCTYELNIDSVSSMLHGDLMPRPPAILSTTIMITFIGREKLSLQRVHNMFRVRRHAVLSALIWLKRNNPGYYGDVVIDASRLDKLPDDGIPEEIVSTMRHDDDEALIEQESSPYVPSESDQLTGTVSGVGEDGTGEL